MLLRLEELQGRCKLMLCSLALMQVLVSSSQKVF